MIQCRTKRIKFSDGSFLVMTEPSWDTSMRLTRLIEDAKKGEKYENTDQEIFRLVYYPRLCAGVVNGNPPSEPDARKMPTRELDKWYLPAKELGWFDDLISEESTASTPEEAEKEAEKKTRKPRQK